MKEFRCKIMHGSRRTRILGLEEDERAVAVVHYAYEGILLLTLMRVLVILS